MVSTADVIEHPSIEAVWEWLEDVPDPEIPVVSVVDLGIVRNAEWRDDTLVVTITPTYSGCPATAVISLDIETALRNHGISNLNIETSYRRPGRQPGSVMLAETSSKNMELRRLSTARVARARCCDHQR